jgi:predicted phosphoadenosine phosphosulfate sulfurtransferase
MIKHGTKNVYEASLERIAIAFRDFDNVLVAFSCGKDSGVMLNLCYEYAKENNLMHKLALYYQDYEAGYIYTHDYAYRVFSQMDIPRKYWLCLPHSAACSVSMYEPRWIPWDEDKRDIWVRDMPHLDCVVNLSNCPYSFIKGTKGFDARIQFAEWFSSEYGTTAVMVGLRADESLTRQAIFTSKHRTLMHKGLRYTKTVNKITCNFYPIFDYETSDIWIANYKFQWDYNKIYDLYYQAGLTPDQMRVASPFHQCGQDSLKLYRVIDPNSWGKMVGRVNGCNFGGIYGGTSAMGWKTITKPEHFTWKQYAEFLMDTLPESVGKKFKDTLARLQKDWKVKGYGRNPRVIQAIKDAGVSVTNTKKISNLCKKEDIYEIITIDGEWPDEITIDNATPFRHCPNWKAVCITIMKNDFSMTYMGATRTKDQNLKKKNALEKFNTKNK